MCCVYAYVSLPPYNHNDVLGSVLCDGLYSPPDVWAHEHTNPPHARTRVRMHTTTMPSNRVVGALSTGGGRGTGGRRVIVVLTKARHVTHRAVLNVVERKTDGGTELFVGGSV